MVNKLLLTSACATVFGFQLMAQIGPTDMETQLKRALLQLELLASKIGAQESRIQELEAERGGHNTRPVLMPAVYTASTTPAARAADCRGPPGSSSDRLEPR